MSEDIKKINKTVASFMLLSLALSTHALAGINENQIADVSMGVTTAGPMPMALYAAPVVAPAQIAPAQSTVQMPAMLYGTPIVDPPQIIKTEPMPAMLYGTPIVQPSTATVQSMPAMLYGTPIVAPPQIIKTEPMPAMLYGTPITPPPQVIKSEPMPMLLYGTPIVQPEQSVVNPQVPQEAVRPNYVTPSKDVQINYKEIENVANKIKKDSDSRTPAGYMAPVIMPGYYIMKDLK